MLFLYNIVPCALWYFRAKDLIGPKTTLELQMIIFECRAVYWRTLETVKDFDPWILQEVVIGILKFNIQKSCHRIFFCCFKRIIDLGTHTLHASAWYIENNLLLYSIAQNICPRLCYHSQSLCINIAKLTLSLCATRFSRVHL